MTLPSLEPLHTAFSSPQKHSRAHAWLVFALVFMLLLSDYMSRQVLNAVFPQLKQDWGLSDTQLGSLSGIVGLMVGMLTLPISLMADRWGRTKSLVLMALLWSLSTLACGLSTSYEQMMVARFFVGVGEAAYGSVGLAVILSVFPASMRATLTGAFSSGGLLGAVLGIALGGAVAARFGWRAAFIVMALFGLLLALLYALTVTERKLVGHLAGSTPMQTELAPPATAAVLRELFGTWSLICVYVGSGLQVFILYAFVAWMPSYLHRYYDMAPDRSAVIAATLLVVIGIGMIVCGVVTDRASRDQAARRATLAATYCLLSAALIMAGLFCAPGAAQLMLLAAGLLLGAGIWGAAGATVTSLIQPRLHATALAMLALTINLLGAALGPFLTGVLADHLGLHGALQWATVAPLAAALVLAIGRYCYPLGEQHVPQRQTRPQVDVEYPDV